MLYKKINYIFYIKNLWIEYFAFTDFLSDIKKMSPDFFSKWTFCLGFLVDTACTTLYSVVHTVVVKDPTLQKQWLTDTKPIILVRDEDNTIILYIL